MARFVYSVSSYGGSVLLHHLRSVLPQSPARLYLFFASLMALSCVLLIPPGQMPDERNHFARVTQISEGGIVGIKNGPNESGGYLPQGFPQEPELLDALRFHPEAKVNLAQLEALSARHWTNRRGWASFGNTSIYAPVTYMPAALVTFVARHTRAGIIQTLYAVHVVNALLTIVLCGLGIALARRGRFYLLILSSLPMVMGLAASSSQDGVLFGLAVLTASLLTRLSPEEPGSNRFWIGVGFVFAVLTISKPPLLLCSLIPLGLGYSKRRLVLGAPFVMSLFGFLLWQHFGLDPAKVQFLEGSGVSDRGQIHWVITHPLALPGLAYRTLQTHLMHLVREFIGVLGWLDTMMPQFFYRTVYLGMLCCMALGAYGALRSREQRQTLAGTLITLTAILLAVGAVFFSLYVIWTPVGAPVIDGVQGRYFLPIAPFLAVAFPAAASNRLEKRSRGHMALMVVLAAFLTLDLVVLSTTLATRYW